MFANCERNSPLQWLAMIVLLLLALLPSHWINPTILDDDWVLRLWWGISFSASTYGLVWVGLLFSLLIAPNWKQALILLLPVLLLIAAGAWLNEHQLKPVVAQPRPNIEFLASHEAGPVLSEGVVAFYGLPDKASRSAYLKSKLDQQHFIQLPPLLKEHWIAESGFSFPSGHAFAAASLSAWFMFLVFCAGKRFWLLPLYWGWALAVSYSRVLLGVHRPGDVMAGVVEGALLALLLITLHIVLRSYQDQQKYPV